MGFFYFPKRDTLRRMEKFPHLPPGGWNLLVLPRQSRNRLLVALAHIARKGPLTVLDCGRQFDASIVARAARGRQEVIDRIRVQRAFICYEAVKLLERTPAGHAPVIVLDFLSTFYDENVKMGARKYLLERSLEHFQRLSRKAGLAVTVHPAPSSQADPALYERLRASAPNVSAYEISAPPAGQMRLF